jgi:tetratricopeptide (TPR) repeat protein
MPCPAFTKRCYVEAMTRRWILLGLILVVVLAPVVFHYGPQLRVRSHIVDLAKLPSPNYEPLPTDDALTVLTKKARLADRARDYQALVDLYTQALEEEVSRPAAIRRHLLRQRAFAYEDLHQYERAEADYTTALQINPVEPDFYAKRGFYFIRRGRYDDALADFRSGAELDPKDGGYSYGEGQVYEKLGLHDKAVERFTEAIRRDAKVTTYYRERGSAYNYLGKYEKALADYDKALALGFKVSLPREEAYSNLGRGYALLQLKQYKRAVDDFDVVLKAVPRSSTALAWRGAAYQGLGNREKAVADYKSALAIDSDSERAIDGLKSLDEPRP